jgi:hypothetical protein
MVAQRKLMWCRLWAWEWDVRRTRDSGSGAVEVADGGDAEGVVGWCWGLDGEGDCR